MKYKIIDLFAGGGGLSLGFINAGYEILAAFDNWLPAIDLYKQNFKKHPIIKLDLSSAMAFEEIAAFTPDIIVGGPPCQDFSSAGKRDESLGRADLTVAFSRIVSKLCPPFFIMENVSRAINSNAFAVAKSVFKKAGYGLTIKILDASLCGVPQLRKRLFVIGEKNGVDGFLDNKLDAHLSSKPMTLRDYFGDKLGIEHYYRHPRSYARRAVFSIDELSPTVRGVNRPVPTGYPGHKGDTCPVNKNVRPLTTGERCMIQTFPASFKLGGSKTEVEQIIGNAVPVKLAEYVALRLKEYLSSKNYPIYSETAEKTVDFLPTVKTPKKTYLKRSTIKVARYG
jgi:DNA (cytosine-5)-methyltransferase 1